MERGMFLPSALTQYTLCSVHIQMLGQWVTIQGNNENSYDTSPVVLPEN